MTYTEIHTFLLDELDRLKTFMIDNTDQTITFEQKIIDWPRSEVQDLLAKYEEAVKAPDALPKTT